MIEVREVETMEEAVEQGAQLLDKYQPGWWRTVRGAMTDGLFHMATWERCMVGTLELWTDPSDAHWDGALISFNGLSFFARSPESRYVGFLPLEDVENEFADLDELWREQVQKRELTNNKEEA